MNEPSPPRRLVAVADDRPRELRLARRAHVEMARRSDPAVLVHPPLLLIVGWMSSLAGDWPAVHWGVVGALTSLALLRWWQVRHFAARYDRAPLREHRLFRAGLLTVSAIWGGYAAFTVVTYGLQGPTILVLICTAGILAGGTINLAIDLVGCLWFQALTAVPFIVASFVEGSRNGIGLGAVSLIYLLVLVIEARHLHQRFWRGLETSEQLQLANETKSRFLASVSHELRTPLTGVIGHIQLLLHGSVREDQRKSLLGAQRSADALLRVINDLLDVSRVEAGKLELVAERFEVEAVLRDAIDTVAPRANAKGLRLFREIDAAVPRWLMGDAGRLLQILLNLLGNAVKFTDSGNISVSVALEAARDDDAILRFVVRDTGIGIPADRRRAIFDAFTQGDALVARRYGGTGLGLNISSQLAQLMGGTMEVESEVGKGSSFEFTARFGLPSGDEDAPAAVEQREDVAPPRTPPQPTTSLRVLLAEDNPHNGHAVSSLLRRRGHTVTLVTDGVHAVAAVELGSDEFDVVLMDINMPAMDGVEATRAIRRIERDSGDHLPIIALTADALPDNRLRCREAGMDAFATKPVNMDELCSLMDRLAASTKEIQSEA